MKKIFVFIALILTVCSAFAQRISPSQLKKGSATRLQVLATDTISVGSKAGDFIPLNLSDEIHRITKEGIQNAWSKSGNAITSSDFIGSTNDENVIFKRAGVEKMRLDAIGLFVGEQGAYTSTPNASAIPAITIGGAMGDIQSEAHILSEEYAGLLADANGNFIKVGTSFSDGQSKILSNVPLYISPANFTNTGSGKAAKFWNLSTAQGILPILESDNSIARSDIRSDSIFLSGGNNFNSVRTFGRKDNFALPFITNNVERMRITQNGNVGIGTTSPTSSLQVQGVISVSAVGDRQIQFARAGANVYSFEHDASRLYFYNVTTGRYPFVITNNSFVGFGTANPSNLVDIYSSTGNPLRLQGLQAGATTDSILTSNNGVVRRIALNTIATITANHTVTNENVILCNNSTNNITVTIPNASSSLGHRVTITRDQFSTGTVTIQPVTSSNQIQSISKVYVSSTTLGSLGNYGQSLEFISNGTAWVLLN